MAEGEAAHVFRSGMRLPLPLLAFLVLIGGALAPTAHVRLVWFAVAALLMLGWTVSLIFSPVLYVGDRGYRVEVRGRTTVDVPWAEVRGARAVPAERAMYVDAGDPARNLLLPPRHGFGFRIDRQGELYANLARRLADRLIVVEQLQTDDKA
jgi:hypothetical protein